MLFMKVLRKKIGLTLILKINFINWEKIMDDIKNFEVDNKIPGKDITDEDLKSKFPLAAKKYDGHKTTIKVGDVEIGGDELIIFAGPNTVENRDMIINTAKEVKKEELIFLELVHTSH